MVPERRTVALFLSVISPRTCDEMSQGDGRDEGCQTTNTFIYYGRNVPLLRLLEDLTSLGNSDHLYHAYRETHKTGKK